MLNAIFIALLLLLRGQAAHINGFVAHKQVWEQDGSGMDIKEWPPFDDPSKTCDGTADETIEITFTDTTGCFQFQTPGFNAGGYPNSTNVTPGRNSYGCQFNNQFGNNNVTGTVTVFKEGFEFEKDDNGACVDLFVFGFVDDVSDQEDFSTMAGMVTFCGTLSTDKIRTFEANFLTLVIRADMAGGGNGAELRLCFD